MTENSMEISPAVPLEDLMDIAIELRSKEAELALAESKIKIAIYNLKLIRELAMYNGNDDPILKTVKSTLNILKEGSADEK